MQRHGMLNHYKLLY